MKLIAVVEENNESIERFVKNVLFSLVVKIDSNVKQTAVNLYGKLPTFSQIRRSHQNLDALGQKINEMIKVVEANDIKSYTAREQGNVILFGKNIMPLGDHEKTHELTAKALYFYYSKQRQQKMRDYFEIELYKLYATICEFYGYKFTNKEPQVRFCETIHDVRQVCTLIKRTKRNIFDFETRPIQDGLTTSEEIKAAAINFKKSLPTMLQITHQAGVGWVIPMYHYESYFNVGQDDDLEIMIYKDGVSQVIDADHEWDDNAVYWIKKRGVFVKMYNGLIANIPARWAKLFLYHYELCFKEGIDNYLREVVFPEVGEIFDDNSIKKIGHNVLFDAKIVLQHILPWRETLYNLEDTMYLVHGINETWGKSLDAVIFRFIYALVGYSNGMDYANDSLLKLGQYGVFDIHGTAVAWYMLEQMLMEDALCYRVHRSLVIPLLSVLLKIEFRGAQLDLVKLEEATNEAEEMRDQLEKEITEHPLVVEYVQRRREWEIVLELNNLKAKQAVWRKESLRKYTDSLRAKHLQKFGCNFESDAELIGHYYLMDRETEGMKTFMSLAEKIYMLQKKDYYNPKFPLKTGVDIQNKITNIEIGNAPNIYSDFNCNSNDELAEIIYKEPYNRDDLNVHDSRYAKRENEARFSTELDKKGRIVSINIEHGGSGYKKDCVMLLTRDNSGKGAKFAVKIGKAGSIVEAAVIECGENYISPNIHIISFSSPAEVHPYLYNQYNLNTRDKKPLGLGLEKLYCTRSRKLNGTDEVRTESGYFPSTGRKILNRLNDNSGFIQKVLEYRAITKILNTYFKGFANLMDDQGSLHTAYRLIRSMRLSSSNPNLQNIPSRAKEQSVAKLSKATKKVFPAPSVNHIFFQKDLSQAELRWAAELWNITSMIDVYRRDGDIHVGTAAAVNDMTEEEFYTLDKSVFKLKRYHAKSVNFGYLYAMLAKKFQEMARDDYGIDITFEEATIWRDRYFRLYPEILDAQLRQKIKGHKQGFVRTAFGSKRHLPNIELLDKYGYDVSNVKEAEKIIKDNKIPWEIKNKVLSAERQAVNSPVQGTSGQGMEFTLVVFDYRIALLDLDAANTNTVHDSALGYVHKNHAEEYLIALGDACDLPPAEEYLGYWLQRVPMKSDDEFGPNWGTQFEIEAPLTDINFDAYNVPNPEYRIGMKALYHGKNTDIKGKTIFIAGYENNNYFVEYNHEKVEVELTELTFIK